MPELPQDSVPKLPSVRDITERANARGQQSITKSRDPFRAAQAEGVNLAPGRDNGLNYERYYNKGAYSRLGFNPYRDNESYYNKNSSKWEDLKDAGSQWWGLAGLGFNTMWSGKSDRDEAREYERYSNIGSTSRGGGYQTFTNAMLNSGYTIGLLSEMAAEEIALAAGTIFTGGAGAEVAAVRTASNVARVADKLKDVYNMSKKMTTVINRMKDLKDVTKAKTLWSATKKVGNAVNPLRGTTDYLRTGRKLDQADGVSKLAQAGKTFGAFYRDIREINLAYDEAQLESGFVSNGLKDDLINEHIQKYGSHPTAEQMQKINEQAQTASASTLAANSLLIYTSNRISFGNTFNKYMPKALRKTAAEVAGGRVVKDFANKKLDFIKAGTDLFGYRTLVNKAKYAKSNLRKMPLKTAKYIGKYTRANFGEGMQEYFQEVIQDAETSMAKDRYLAGVAGGAWYNSLFTDQYMDAYSKSLSKFANAEGAEIFAGGFIMGGFAGPFGHVLQRTTQILTDKGTYKRVYDREGWTKDKEEFKARQDKFQDRIDEFNNMTDTRKEFLKNYVDFLTRQAAYKASMDKSSEESNPKDFYDKKDQSLVDQILFAEQMGGSDLIIEAIKDMGNADIQDAQVDGFEVSHDDIIKQAESIVKLSEDFDKIFPEPDIYGYEKDSDFGYKKSFRHLKEARYKAKRDVIMNQHALVRTMERMDNILKSSYSESKAPFWNKKKIPPSNEITKIFNTIDMKQELFSLKDEIASLEGFTQKDPNQRKDLAYKKKIYKILSEFTEEGGPLDTYQKSLNDEELVDLTEPVRTKMAVGSTLRYKSGARVWEGEVVGETKKGQPQWVVEKENGKRVTILKTSSGISSEAAEQTKSDFSDTPTERLRNSFKKYMTAVAEEYGNSINQAEFESAFQDFKDFYALDSDQTNLSKTVSFLMDPEAHYAMVEKYNKMVTDQYENLESQVEDQMEKYKEAEKVNDLIQMLAKSYNVIIAEDDLNALVQDNLQPDDFYNITTGEPLRPETETYAQVTEAVSNWMVEVGKKEAETKVEEEVKEETTVAEEPVQETGPVTGKVHIDETPFERWPEELVKTATNLMNAYNQDTDEEFDDVENFVSKNNPGHGTMSLHISRYNKQFDTEAAVKPRPSVAAEPPKDETPMEKAARMSKENITIPDQEVEPTVESKGAPIIDTEKAFSIELSDDLEASLFSGDRELVAFEPTKKEIKQILQGLRDGKMFPITGNISDLKPGTVITLVKKTSPNKKKYIELTYEGQVSFKELDLSPEEAVDQFDLKISTKEESTIDLAGKRYAVPGVNHTLWFGNAGKLNVFKVSAPVEKKISPTEESTDAWTSNIEMRFAQSEDLDKTLNTIIEENAIRIAEDRPNIESDEIMAMYEQAQGELTPDKLEVNQEYKVNIRVQVGDKSVNFGTALVSEKSPNGVTFKSTGKDTKGQVKFINAETLPKVLKGKVSTDMRAEDIVEKPEITKEEETLLTDSKENKKPLSQDRMQELATEAKSMTAAERRAKLKEDRKKRCKG